MKLAGPGFGKALRTRWSGLPPNLRGAIWIVLSCICFSTMAAIVKALGARLDSLQLAFLRAVFGLLFTLPFVLRAGLDAVRTRHLGLHLSRGLMGGTGMVCGFYALTHMSLAEATAIGFTKPLFMVVLAALVFHETVRARRWTATAIGFLGVLIMLRPGQGVFEPAAVVALLGAFAAATVGMLIKQLGRTEPTVRIIFYLGAVTTLATAVPAALVWIPPTPLEIGLMGFGAGLASLAQICLIRGFQAGEASALAPLDYVRLPIAALYGLLLFGEIPDAQALAGAVLIVASTLYISHREAQLGRRRPPEPRAPAEP